MLYTLQRFTSNGRRFLEDYGGIVSPPRQLKVIHLPR